MNEQQKKRKGKCAYYRPARALHPKGDDSMSEQLCKCGKEKYDKENKAK